VGAQHAAVSEPEPWGQQASAQSGNPARFHGSSGEAHAPLETRATAPDYQTSRAIREAYAARLAKLEFEERTGKLISKAEVDVKFFQLARQLRDRLQQIPRKLAPEIVALVVADPDVRGVTDILDVAIREALEDLAQ